MTLRVTAAEADVLVISEEIPEPIPLVTGAGLVPVNPMLFNPNWGVEISIETRWMTDITKSHSGTKSESFILSSRPSRKLKASIVGASKEDSHAILLSCIGYTVQLGAPVALYPDSVEVTSFSLNGNIGTVGGDFRYRRFFMGARVAFMAVRVDPDQAAKSVVMAIIKGISPDVLTVEFNPLAYRAISLSDAVCPCIDVELLSSSSGTAHTDSVSTTELEWNELDGSNTLPGIWPAISAENADLLSPFCQIIDNIPLFPLAINWANEVEVSIERDMESNDAGRTAVQEPTGQTRMVFEVSVMGYDRPSCWRILRFFDAVRGRAADFYFIHPQRPWTLTSFPNLTSCMILATGNLTLMAFYKKVALIRADGTVVTREITSMNQFSGVYQLHFAALPDTNFVEAQPIFICKFDSDSIEEAWNTNDKIPNISLRLEEQPQRGLVDYSGTLGYEEQLPTILAGIPGCNLFMKAGSECEAADNKPASVWPGRGGPVNLWFDTLSRLPTSRLTTVKPPQRYFGRTTSNLLTDLIRFPLAYRNRGQPAIKDPGFSFLSQLDNTKPVGDRTLWGTTGWTMTLCYTPDSPPVALSDRPLFNISQAAGWRVGIYYDVAGAAPGQRQVLVLGKPVPGAQVFPLSYNLSPGDFANYVTIRFDNTESGGNGRVRVWVNGQKALPTAIQYTIDQFPSYDQSLWFWAFQWSEATSAAVIANRFGHAGCANMVVSFPRPLTAPELDLLHQNLANLYGSPFAPVSLYA